MHSTIQQHSENILDYGVGTQMTRKEVKILLDFEEDCSNEEEEENGSELDPQVSQETILFLISC